MYKNYKYTIFAYISQTTNIYTHATALTLELLNPSRN